MFRASERKTKGIPPNRYGLNFASDTMSTPTSPSFRGFPSPRRSSEGSSDLDRTIVPGQPPSQQQQQQHTSDDVKDASINQMCHLIAALQSQMLQMQQNSEQRDAAMVERILELDHRISTASNDSRHSDTRSDRDPTLPDAISPPDGSIAESINNGLCPITTTTTTTHASIPCATTVNAGSNNNKGVYTQSTVSGLATNEHVDYTSGAVGPDHKSVHPHSHAHSSVPVHQLVHSRPAHVYTSASWTAASHVGTHTFQTAASSTHVNAHIYGHRPVSHQQTGYYAGTPQPPPPPPRRHHESPWPAYGSSYAAGQQQMSAGVPRLENRRLLDLPTFTGLPEDWPKFNQAFLHTTEAYGYNNVENLLRLQKSLSGEAERAVESLLIHPAHVQQVMETLSDTFGHPDLLIRSQIDRVRRLAPVHESHLELLVPFANVVRNVATYLDAPTTQHHLANPILLEELVQKLPVSRRVDWAFVATQIRPYATVLDFSVWISSVARLVRHALPVSTATKSTAVPNNVAGRTNNRQQTTKRVLLNATNDSSEGEPRFKCSYCKKEHDTERCYSFKRLSVTERWKIVNDRSWCYGCLSDKHILPGCSAKRKCTVDDCALWHHTLLHERDNATHRSSFNEDAGGRKHQGDSRQRRQTSVPKSNAQPKTSVQGGSTTAQVHVEPSGSTQQAHVCTVQERTTKSTLLFRVMPITLHANGRELQTYALIDEGSSVSLIDDRIADDLGLDGPLTDLSMKWFGKQTTVLRSRKLTIGISGQARFGRQYAMNVRTIRNLSLPSQTVEPDRLYESNPHLRDVPLEAFANAVPRVLIGLDNHHLSIPLEVKTSEDDDGLVAVRSKLGWTVYGSDGPVYQPQAMVLTIDGERDEEYELLNEIVRGFITSEEFGVRTPQTIIESDDDIRARSILHRTTKRIGDRFEVGLLWRRDNIVLPPSYDMALRRLVNVEARMRREPAYAEQYVNQIQSYLDKGYARKLNDDELLCEDSRAWYLPHFAVVNPNKPGKFRLVFDAAAKVRGESLNSALLSGPDENMPLARLLLQFRLGEVGVCADIAEMFHQVRIREEDQTAQRFLWRSGDSSTPPEVYAMTVMTFGATCSPAAAQHVKNVNADEFRSDFPDAVDAIQRRHYVDDYVASFATPEEAARVSLDVVEIHRRGGFILRGFVSNNSAVLQALGVSTGPGDQINLEPESTFEKILGMTWDTTDDTFCFRTKFNRVPQGVLDGTVRPTKRSILSTCMSVFDPFGLLANFMLSPKLMVQDLYRMGSDWDEPASDEIWQRWEVWRNEIIRTQLLRVPRCPFYNVDAITDIQLHIYADASEAAFAAVAFWRVSRGTKVDLSFVLGKVKVSPTQLLSIPRLELNAAVLATRLLDEIQRSHDSIRINKIVMWTDSETVLKWIRSDQRKYKQYVGFRVAEIAASTPSSLWRWVPTSMNVADDGTRVRNPPVFDPNGRWLWGPAWLLDDENTWPKQRSDLNDAIEPCSEEVRPKYVGVTVFQPFIKFDRFSSYTRLCRSAAWVLRFRHNALSKKRNLQITRGELTAGEVEEGLKLLCRIVQQEVYDSEYSALTRGKELNQTSSIFMLSPYLDQDGLMRLHGRTDAASDKHLGYDARRPIILPRQHHFTMLMVRYYHQRLAHQLIEATIAAVRKRFWVPQVRVLVRMVHQTCQKCRFRTASPEAPIQGQLPLDRLTPHVRPFASTGLDYFGPVMVRIGRRHEKRWVALFTCLAVRAVHLEIASNLSTDACLLCIRNLINLRGVPNLIRCDNGTNFVGAKNKLDKETGFFDSDAVQRELSTRGIEWKFNRPGNPEAGGVWERLVQSVKRVLEVTLQEVTPEVETLRAHLIEAANIINSRPLTHIPVDPEDDDPLTPNHFLVGGSNLTTVPNPADVQSLCSREQWVRCREMSRQFWSLWIRDYLPELTRRSRHYPKREPPRVGDLVIVCDDGQPRSRWIRGRIVEIATGADGVIRTAKVRTADGEYWRPTTKLAVLDVSPPRINSADGARDVAIC